MSSTKTASVNCRITLQITDSTKYSQLWRAFFSVLNSGLTDVKGRTKKYIFSSHPDEKITDTTDDEEIKSEYPIIVVGNVTSVNDVIILDNNKREYSFSIPISIYADRSDYLDQIMSSIESVLSSSTTNDFLSELNAYNLKQTSMRYSSVQRGGVKVHIMDADYDFQYVGI